MKEGKMKQRLSYAFGALGHDVYYYSISTFFIAFVTAQMFAGTPHEDAMIALVTSLVVIIRLIEIIFDPIIGSIIDNTHTRWGKFKPWVGCWWDYVIFDDYAHVFRLLRTSKK